MKNRTTSFKAIVWLLSIAMLLVWLMSMSFVTYTQAENYRRQMLAAGSGYASQVVNRPYLRDYVYSRHLNEQLQPDVDKIIELRMMDAIGWLGGDMSRREYLLPGQKVPADAAVIIDDKDGKE